MSPSEKQRYELGHDASPVCKKGRHDRCAAYDHMAVRCTCACHSTPGSPGYDEG